jgi:hypothetical protein
MRVFCNDFCSVCVSVHLCFFVYSLLFQLYDFVPSTQLRLILFIYWSSPLLFNKILIILMSLSLMSVSLMSLSRMSLSLLMLRVSVSECSDVYPKLLKMRSECHVLPVLLSGPPSWVHSIGGRYLDGFSPDDVKLQP